MLELDKKEKKKKEKLFPSASTLFNRKSCKEDITSEY